MHKPWLITAAAVLAAAHAFYSTAVQAQSPPMVPSATPGPVPVMPTTPAQPMPMPGSDTSGGPMIPKAMPMPPGASTTPIPMPMPGTTGASAGKPVIQINIAIIDTPAGFPVIFAGSKDAKTGMQNDLRAARALAESRHVTLTTVASPALTTLDGAAATLSVGPSTPDTSKPSGATTAETKMISPPQGYTLSALSHRNPDGTVTVKVSYTYPGPAKSDVSKPGTAKIATQTFETTQAFHSGDTLLLGRLTKTGPGARLLFATATVFRSGRADQE